MGVQIAVVNTAVDTFEVWVQQTNELIADLAAITLTANNDANGSHVVGNSYLIGILGVSGLVAANTIRGGNVQSSQNLTITSNVLVTGASLGVGAGTSNVSASANAIRFANSTAHVDFGVLGMDASADFTITANLVHTGDHISLGSGAANAQLKSSSIKLQNSVASFLLSVGGYALGNSTVNVVANSSALVFSNASISLTIDTAGEILYAGNLKTTANLSMNTDNATVWIGNTTINALANSSALVFANASVSLTIDQAGEILYAGTLKTNANLYMNTATSTLALGNSTVNSVANSINYRLANASATLDLQLGALLYAGQLKTNANLYMNTTSSTLAVGNSTVNSVANSTNYRLANSVATLDLQLGSLIYAGTLNTTANLFMNTDSATLWVGNTTINALANSSALVFSNASVSLTIDQAGEILYAGTLKTNANLYMNTTSSTLWLGNSTVNSSANSTVNKWQNATASMTLSLANLSSTVDVTFNPNVVFAGFTSVGNSTVNAVTNSSALVFANSLTTLTIDQAGEILYAGTLKTNANLLMNTATSQVSIGNSTVNAIANSTALLFQNSISTFTIDAAGELLFAGSLTTTANLNMNTATSTVWIGNSTVNVFSNSTMTKWSNATANMALTLGQIAYKGTLAVLCNTDFSGSLVTVDNKLSVGNSTINVSSNSLPAINLANDLAASMLIEIGLIQCTNTNLMITGNATVNGSLTVTGSIISVDTSAGALTWGNSTVNNTVNSTSLAVRNTVGSSILFDGSLTYDGGTFALPANDSVAGFVTVGNSTVNAVANSSALVFANSILTLTVDLAGEILYAGTLKTNANLFMNTTTSTLLIGNATVNALANSIVYKLQNSTVAMTLGLASLGYTGASYGVTANVDFSGAFVTVDNIFNIGNSTVNAVANSSALVFANSLTTMTIDQAGEILFAGQLKTNANLYMNTTTSTQTIGNSSVNSVANSLSVLFQNSSVIMNYGFGSITYGGVVSLAANLSQDATHFFSWGNSTVNAVANSTDLRFSNSTATLDLQLGALVFAGTINTTANLSMNTTTSTIWIGNTTVNVIANSTIIKMANSTVNTQLTVPTSGNWTDSYTFLHANGSWVSITTGVFEPYGQLGGINTQNATAYTLALTDKGKTVEVNNTSAATVTVPNNATIAFPTNTVIDIVALNSGKVTIAAGTGVTLRSASSWLSIGDQYGGATLYKRGADEWVVLGDLAA